MAQSITVARTCNVPFETVVDQFQCDAPGLIRMATDAAADKASEIVMTLDSRWAWFDVHEQVRAHVGEFSRGRTDAQLELSWAAEAGKRLLPGVDGRVTLFAMSTAHTEVGFSGNFVPPPGLLGNASGVLLGRRVAEASVGHFLDQMVTHLERSAEQPAVAKG